MTTIWNDGNNKIEAERIPIDATVVGINLSVTTRNFSGRHTLFVRRDEIKTAVDTLENMFTDLQGNLYLSDNESDSFLRLYQDMDSWLIEGQLGCSWQHNLLLFRISVDQTVIKLLWDFLLSSVREADNL